MNTVLKTTLVALAFAIGGAMTTTTAAQADLFLKPHPGIGKIGGGPKFIKPHPGLKGIGPKLPPLHPLPWPPKGGKHSHGHGNIDVDIVIGGGGYGGGYVVDPGFSYGCSSGEALWKAKSIGVKNRWVQSVSHKNVVVRGTISGDPVKVVMKRKSANCAVRYMNYL